jgi:hypothetical protein
MFLDGIVTRVLEVYCAFIWLEYFQERAGAPPCRFDDAFRGVEYQVLEFDEDLFDRGKVGTIGRRKRRLRSPIFSPDGEPKDWVSVLRPWSACSDRCGRTAFRP